MKSILRCRGRERFFCSHATVTAAVLNPSVATVVPVPFSYGQPNCGPNEAPIALVNAGLVELLGRLQWRVQQEPPFDAVFQGSPTDSTDLDPKTRDNVDKKSINAELRARNAQSVGHTCHQINKQVTKVLENDTPDRSIFPLILGGDHCISIGTVSALKSLRKRMGVVWVDAHADINTPENSGTGNMHGMPLGFLLGLAEAQRKSHPLLQSFKWFSPCLQPQELLYIGLRDLDDPERAAIRSLGIKAYTMHDIDRKGIGKIMEEVMDHFFTTPVSSDTGTARCSELHLSFDIDAMDPFFAPHTGTAVTGGLTFREGNFICEELAASGRLTSMELVEVDPRQHYAGSEHRKTVDMALTLIGSAMGETIL